MMVEESNALGFRPLGEKKLFQRWCPQITGTRANPSADISRPCSLSRNLPTRLPPPENRRRYQVVGDSVKSPTPLPVEIPKIISKWYVWPRH